MNNEVTNKVSSLHTEDNNLKKKMKDKDKKSEDFFLLFHCFICYWMRKNWKKLNVCLLSAYIIQTIYNSERWQLGKREKK